MSLLNSIASIFSHFSTLDYCFVAVLVVAMLAGGLKGFCKQVVSWFFWVMAGYIAYFYSHQLADMLIGDYITTPILRVLLIDFGLLITAMLMSFIINRVMQGLLMLTGMSVFDRFLGVYFGMIQGLVLIAVVITGFSSTGVKNEIWWRNSRVVVMTSALMPVYAEDFSRLIEYSLKNLSKLWIQGVGDEFSWSFDHADTKKS